MHANNHVNYFTDIDECALNTDGCAQICNNTIGSYHCSCRTGYRLASNGHMCQGTVPPTNTDSYVLICVTEYCSKLT